MNYLITGGAGFIGSNLADRLLLSKNNVIVYDNFNDYYDVNQKNRNVKNNIGKINYKIYKNDLEDFNSLKKVFDENKIDIVVHLGGRAGVRPSINNPESYVLSNILGTLNVLECMRTYKVKKLIFASSSSVYGNCKEESFKESLNVSEPISPYAMTKKSCEEICYTYHHLYDLDIVCLRFFTVYGKRQRPDLAISKFFRKIINDETIEMYGDGTSKRDYTFIDDIVEGICLAINYNKSKFEIFNLGGGEPISLKRMIETIEKVVGKKAKIIQKPMQQGDVNKTICDLIKSKELLGFYPKTKFEDGIKLFYKWLKNIDKG